METVSSLENAIRIALEAHKNQEDKAGESYILHPLRLMLKFEEDDLRIAAVLHDVVEDSAFDLDYLKKEGFSSIVLSVVEALTRRSGETYDAFIERLAGNDLAVRIKIEDLKDNMNLTRIKRVTNADLQRVKKYHTAQMHLMELQRSRFTGGHGA